MENSYHGKGLWTGTLQKHSPSSFQTAAKINEIIQNNFLSYCENQAVTGFLIYSSLNLQALGGFLELQ